MESPRLAAVVGWPIGQSLSPAIHRLWAAREDRNAHYVPIAAPPSYEAFVETIAALRTLQFRGCNVTHPHKDHALKLADAASDAARRIGAANMLTFGEDGALFADNSDHFGFAQSIAPAGPRRRALVLGAGGAARAVLFALADAGVEAVVANRSEANAGAAAAPFRARVIPWAERNTALADADLLVNATTLGMAGAPPLDLDLALAPDGTAVVDLVYAPLDTPLLKAARARDLLAIDGLGMLMHQARAGYRAWLGDDPAVDNDLRRTLEAELRRRARP